MTPHLNSMSIFDAPRVVAVRSEDCLSIHIGQVTICIYGHDPYKVAPELLEMTAEQWSRERTRQILGDSWARRDADEAAQVPTDVPTGDAPDSVGQAG